MANIFLVDDDLASELLAENLHYRGHRVERVSSVDDAISQAKLISDADLVILDLVMPRSEDVAEKDAGGSRSTGMLVFRELRRERADLPILVYTANQDASVIDAIEADGHATYISRWSSPKFKEFVAVVHRMLGIEPPPARLQSLIVHGHDEKTKLEVKNYLQNTLGLPEPTILHEQPNHGRTLIEKFEDLGASADLAFVILTPDDVVADPSSGDPAKRRARQNVILELGFFLGTFGRHSWRVFLLYKGPLELPSDLSGVVYLDIGMGVASVGDQIRLEIEGLSKRKLE